MTEMTILFEKNEVLDREYFIAELGKNRDFKIELSSGKSVDTVSVKSDNGLLKDYVWEAIASVILQCHKFRAISTRLFKMGAIKLQECLIIGALLGFDAASERKEILEQMTHYNNSISINGLLKFKLQEVANNWVSLVYLATKLLLQCADKSDYLDVVFFLMAASCNADKRMLICNREGQIRLDLDGEEIIIPTLTENHEGNALIALISQSPTTINIINKERVSGNFYNIVKCLGEHVATK
ncbi:MAG: hypothetical protein R3Y23_00845 [Bacillota bacterium]